MALDRARSSRKATRAARALRRIGLLSGLCSLLGVRGVATAADQGANFSRAHPFTNIVANTARCFTGSNLILHTAGVVATPVIVVTGTDTAVHDTLARHQRLESYSVVGVYLGYGLPLLVGGGLMAAGFGADSQREIVASGAVLQSTLLALGYQSVLKAFTGRPAPPAGVLDNDEPSKRFRFGFMRGGIHYGWPSGHMMTATAIVTSLVEVYPENLWIAAGGGALVTGMAASVALHESSSMHWFSDMAAGTLMGVAIGRGVGAGFSELVSAHEIGITDLRLSPLLGIAGVRGLCLSGAW
jgi:membrane-associated phospholipid phosphatase